jgi:hypothetical protein
MAANPGVEWIVAPTVPTHRIRSLVLAADCESATIAVELVLPNGTCELREGVLSAGELYACVRTKPATFDGKET